MRVGLNLIFLTPGETGGMEVVARALVPALKAAAPAHTFTAYVGREAAADDLGADEQVVVPVRASSRPQWVLGEQVHLPRLVHDDVLHSLGSTAPARGPFARVVTIHDLHFLTSPEAHFGVRALGMRLLVPLAARSAHRIIAVSEHTKGEIVSRLGTPAGKVDVVPNGLGRLPDLAPTAEGELRARLALGRRPVLLCLSAKRPHKNLTGLLDALARIPPERRPVAVLPGYPTPHEQELRDRAHRLGITGDVRFLGWLSEADVEGLFAITSGFVFPSLSEGFGLPVLEAMARGVPVACSDRASLPEVAGDAALLFDPLDPAAIAAAIEQLPARRPELRERGLERAARFTWERAARLTLETYERASRQASTFSSGARS